MKLIDPEGGVKIEIPNKEEDTIPIIFDPDTGEELDKLNNEGEIITKLREQLKIHIRIVRQCSNTYADKNNELQLAAMYRYNKDAQRLLDLTKEWE